MERSAEAGAHENRKKNGIPQIYIFPRQGGAYSKTERKYLLDITYPVYILLVRPVTTALRFVFHSDLWGMLHQAVVVSYFFVYARR